jgi:hypothetical protein
VEGDKSDVLPYTTKPESFWVDWLGYITKILRQDMRSPGTDSNPVFLAYEATLIINT